MPTLLVEPGPVVVNAYGPGGFKISGTLYTGPLLLLPDGAWQWEPLSAHEILPQHVDPIRKFKDEIDFLIVGVGPSLTVMSKELRQMFDDAAISVDFMDTSAALRTYNVLIDERRRCAAAILPL